MGNCKTIMCSQDKLVSLRSKLGKGRQGQQQHGPTFSNIFGVLVVPLLPMSIIIKYSRYIDIVNEIWIIPSVNS